MTATNSDSLGMIPMWSTMDTAPKDGTKIDLWVVTRRGDDVSGERVADAWYGEHRYSNYRKSACWVVYDQVWDTAPVEDKLWVGKLDGIARETTATHWRPIPSGPRVTWTGFKR